MGEGRRPEPGRFRDIEVRKYWELDDLRTSLAASPMHLNSWKDLEQVARSSYADLIFAENSFAPLSGHPFGLGAAERILLRLGALHDLKHNSDVSGALSLTGQALYQKHFEGEKAWFSDSSHKEKSDFRSSLTFKHPAKEGEWLFCTWHGKLKTPQLRVQFSWPIRSSEPIYVVYIGPKITKR